MVSAASPAPRPHWHKAFLALLPAILKHAKIAFAYLKPEARAEAVQEVVANACQAYARLVELGKTDIAYAAALAAYGKKQARDGRKVGGHLNCLDVSSAILPAIEEDRRRSPRQVRSRRKRLGRSPRRGSARRPRSDRARELDFSDWLDSLKRRDRRVAEFLAQGETTKTAAKSSVSARAASASCATSLPPTGVRSLAMTPALPLPTRPDPLLWLASCHAPRPSPGRFLPPSLPGLGSRSASFFQSITSVASSMPSPKDQDHDHHRTVCLLHSGRGHSGLALPPAFGPLHPPEGELKTATLFAAVALLLVVVLLPDILLLVYTLSIMPHSLRIVLALAAAAMLCVGC